MLNLMRLYADLHVHSKYSRAVSRDMDLLHIDEWAKKKGIGLMGTGDFTHPAWLASLRQELVEDGSGILRLQQDPQGTAFVLSSEISCIYSKNGKGRRMHLVVLAPDLQTVEAINNRLGAIGNLHSDGRPILGLDAEELVKIVLDCNERCLVIPAHIWTPWFSLFGSASGFDTIDEAFGSMAQHIYAIETGLSSDPPMNWRLKQLDPISIVSFSDAHSPKPNKMGREVTEFELTSLTYDNLVAALKAQPTLNARQVPDNRIVSTIEFFPEEGKYHWDGHRDHKLRWSPAETKKHQGICTICGKRVTVGVESRVEQLADRPAGYQPEHRPPFKRLIPLEEIIAEAVGVNPGTKKVGVHYQAITKQANEFTVLQQTPIERIAEWSTPKIAEGVDRVRAGKLHILPGYDGEYGTIEIFDAHHSQPTQQPTLFS